MPSNTRDETRKRLDHALMERLARIQLYERYYSGEHRLAFATAKFREAFGELLEEFATNWCGLVVDVAAERLGVLGFRFGEASADMDASKIWQANGLDAKSMIAHTLAIKAETAYLLVSPVRKSEENDPKAQPRITIEHPSQFIVEHDPSDRSIRLAALKKYVDKNGDTVCVLYLPDEIVEYRRKGSVEAVLGLGFVLPFGVDEWDTVDSQPNPLGIIPAVPMENAPDLLTGGTSDLKPAIALNDAANKFFTDMIVASEYTSFPQRVVTGVELPRDPITKEVLPDAQLRAAMSRLWAFEGDNAKVFDLKIGDLDNYVAGVDMAVQHLAAQTRTPPHYLLAKLANLSGDALKAAETGLVARCRRKHLDFSDSWEEAMRIAFAWRARWHARNGRSSEAARDTERSKMTDAETIWSDPESRHPSIVADSLVKKEAIGVPWEALMEEAGYTPQQIERMRKWREADLEADAKRTLVAAEALAKIQAANAPKVPAKPASKLSPKAAPNARETAKPVPVSG